ncbi:unnamed protein product [Arctia plantaginis]|uniref:Uncharacterized protein n=1 Tax=Arctia plantaginis TaxID=874455 RepID=A0A8S0ZEY2_ARCPL|nr:unnamed protein product [Arctia plantaginis]
MTEPEEKNADGEKEKKVKLPDEGGEDEQGEGEAGRKKMKRFQLPNLPRWWQAKIIQYAFAHPHVRARLEKHMGSNLVKLTDKSYMTELEERIRAVNEEGLNKRISARVRYRLTSGLLNLGHYIWQTGDATVEELYALADKIIGTKRL